ncbi:MAG: hypothetical protein WC781_04990 [Candidatus Pacearchaeota archaeon]|jgi:hypothetical protein
MEDLFFKDPEYNDIYDFLIGGLKLDLSKLANRDVGTPFTVDFLIKRASAYGPLPEHPTREELIKGYLFNTIYDDSDAPDKSRFKGELMRWEAQRRGVNPKEIKVDNILKKEYALAHGLNLRRDTLDYLTYARIPRK